MIAELGLGGRASAAPTALGISLHPISQPFRAGLTFSVGPTGLDELLSPSSHGFQSIASANALVTVEQSKKLVWTSLTAGLDFVMVVVAQILKPSSAECCGTG